MADNLIEFNNDFTWYDKSGLLQNFKNACLQGNLEMAKFLSCKFNYDISYEISLLLIEMSKTKYINILKWLFELYEPDYQIIKQMFLNSCIFNQLEIAQFLKCHFDLTWLDILEGYWKAIKNDHINIINWIYQLYDSDKIQNKSINLISF